MKHFVFNKKQEYISSKKGRLIDRDENEFSNYESNFGNREAIKSLKFEIV